MRKRYRYALLCVVPGLAIAALLALLLFGALAGALWLFVFGDAPWPAATEFLLPAVGLLAFLAAWSGIVAGGYHFGKAREGDGRPIPRRHLLCAAVATLLPVVLWLLQQRSVGNLGPKSDSLLCSDYCRERGYAGSGTPPRDSGVRSCSCYDASGNTVLQVPLETLAVGR